MSFLSCVWDQWCAAAAATGFGSCAYVARRPEANATDGIDEGAAEGCGSHGNAGYFPRLEILPE